jgi:hypothetical protein
VLQRDGNLPRGLSQKTITWLLRFGQGSPRTAAARDFAFADCTSTPFPAVRDPQKLCIRNGFDPALSDNLGQLRQPLLSQHTRNAKIARDNHHIAVDGRSNEIPIDANQCVFDPPLP